tara:strand:- start:1981 stop:2418 length:438 start_codon:yes stop_codon:yes gene_type:complete
MSDIQYLTKLLNKIKQKETNNKKSIVKKLFKLKKNNSLYKKNNNKINSYFKKLNNDSDSDLNINNYISIITNLDEQHKNQKEQILNKLKNLYKTNKSYNIYTSLIQKKLNNYDIINLHKNIINFDLKNNNKNQLIQKMYQLNNII